MLQSFDLSDAFAYR